MEETSQDARGWVEARVRVRFAVCSGGELWRVKISATRLMESPPCVAHTKNAGSVTPPAFSFTIFL